MSGVNDGTSHEGCLVITLPLGQWCRIQPGIAFEITQYNKSVVNPRYVVPIGNGAYDVYSEADETCIKVTRHSDENSSNGLCVQSDRTVHFGLFNKLQAKSQSSSDIIYFNQPNNYEESSGRPSNLADVSIGPHT